MDTGDRFGGSDRLERIASGRARTWNSCWRRLAGVASSRVSRGGNRFTGAEIYPRCRRRCRETRRYPPRLELKPAVSRASCYYRTRALTTLATAALCGGRPVMTGGKIRPKADADDRVWLLEVKRVEVLGWDAFPTDSEEIGVVLASVSVTGGPRALRCWWGSVRGRVGARGARWAPAPTRPRWAGRK